MRAKTGCGGVAVLRLGKKSGAAAVTPHRRPNRRGVVPAVLSLTPLGFGLSSQETVGLVAAIMAQGVVTLRDRMARIQVSASGLIAIRVTSECIISAHPNFPPSWDLARMDLLRCSVTIKGR